MNLFTPALVAVSLLLINPTFASPHSPPSPAGAWQTSDGTARVKVSMCGDGTQLCAVLTSISGKARTPGNLRLLNTYVVAGAQRATANVWQGIVHFNGDTAQGKITLVTAGQIELNGCKLGMCKTLLFERV
jgi:uncharacterized protein (DUF2147 family)